MSTSFLGVGRLLIQPDLARLLVLAAPIIMGAGGETLSASPSSFQASGVR